jgi:SAM-dependent methyltransferase
MIAGVTCRLCGNNRVPVWFNAWDHAIYACHKCDFMFALPLAGTQKLLYEPEYYSEFIERDKQADMLQFYSGVLEELKRMTPGRRLLDAGCGVGSFLHFAEQLGWSVIGIDASKAAVRYAAETHHLDVVLADLNEYELPQNAYDVIWAFHTVEHLSDPIHFIKSAAAALQPDGLFYLGLPFYPCTRIRFHQLLFSMGIANHPFNFNLPDHVSYFNRKTIHRALSDAGLEAVRSWLTAKMTLAELFSTAKQSAGMRKAIGSAISPFDKVFGKLGHFQHINVIARKRQPAI